MAAGVGGFFAAGPVGAFAAGAASGSAIDTAFSAAEGKLEGTLASAQRVIDDKHKAGALFDLIGGVTFDGLTGHTAGQAAGKIAGTTKKSQHFKLYLHFSKYYFFLFSR